MTKPNDPLWQTYARSVKRLRADAVAPKTTIKKPVPKPASPVTRLTPPVAPPLRPTKPPGPTAALLLTGPRLEHRREKALRHGDLAIESRIDLHGMTQAAAHAALLRFIDTAIVARWRCVLVITGKGRDGTGVLRTALRGWLADSRAASSILALRPAANRHGGHGAFYIILRRGTKAED